MHLPVQQQIQQKEFHDLKRWTLVLCFSIFKGVRQIVQCTQPYYFIHHWRLLCLTHLLILSNSFVLYTLFRNLSMFGCLRPTNY